MDLEQLQDLAEKDLKINDTELDLESLKTPQLHNKYLKFLNKWKLLQTKANTDYYTCLLYTSPSPRDGLLSRMPSSA